ncbi:MAG: hypothetical protein IT434_15180 [Phycisphaerales bacterium]|jgi:hypothetical protein|nr:hypothetical protein [Phycisphaerales bacterium]
MLLCVVGSIVLTWSSAAAVDPSLSPAAACGEPTPPQVVAASSELELDRLLLGYQGVVLYWNPASASFTMYIDGTEVGDLSTRATGGLRWEFSGRFVDGKPALTGFVDNPNGSTWSVEVNVPGRKPAAFVVQGAGESIQILSGTICDCSDRVSLECKNNRNL